MSWDEERRRFEIGYEAKRNTENAYAARMLLLILAAAVAFAAIGSLLR